MLLGVKLKQGQKCNFLRGYQEYFRKKRITLENIPMNEVYLLTREYVNGSATTT